MALATIHDLTLNELDRVAWSGPPRHLQYVAEAIERVALGEVDYLAVHVDDDIVALSGVDYTAYPDVGLIWQLGVRKDMRSRGYGSLLIGALEERMRERRVSTAQLCVSVENERATKLYRRLGYGAVGNRTERWQVEDENGNEVEHVEDGIVMEKRLTLL